MWFPLFFAIFSVPHLVIGTQLCRCTPRDSCWPSEELWNALNRSVDGNLVKVLPIGHVCYHPTYDPEKCDEVTVLEHDSNWRAAQPGALQNFNWENLPSRQESCYVNANVQSARHIQEVINFARKHNVRLVIKNTGHDSSGRSGAPDSLQILTNRLKDIKFSNRFTPAGGPEEADYGPVVSFGAGVMGGELYEASAAHGYSIVSGECTTVGIAGGYIQGGGVSTALSPMRGLGSDQVVEMEVVTAKGDIVIANEFQHEDLFWALRGGGGGTFGVVTRVTARVYPDVPTVITHLHLKLPRMDELFWDIVKNLAAVTRELSTGNTSGQYAVGREPDLNGAYFVNLTMFFYPESTKMPTEAEEALAPFLGKLRAADLDYIYSVDALPKISSFLTIPRAVDLGGGGYIQGNVLLSHDFTYSETGLSQMADKLSELEYHPGDLFTVNVLGGSVISNGKSIDSAVHPGWRSSSLLVVVMRPFLPDFAAQTRAHDRLTNIDMPALLSIEKKPLAVYLNEADPNERDFRNLFWGNNYPRLLRIKRKWDPDGLFVVRKGVGSEMWDEEGVCRVFDSAKEL